MVSEYRKGTLRVGVKTEDGMTLTEEYGFRVEEEKGKILNFDLIAHPDYGFLLLFANAVCMLSYWTNEQLEEARSMVNKAVANELERRGVENVTS